MKISPNFCFWDISRYDISYSIAHKIPLLDMVCTIRYIVKRLLQMCCNQLPLSIVELVNNKQDDIHFLTWMVQICFWVCFESDIIKLAVYYKYSSSTVLTGNLFYIIYYYIWCSLQFFINLMTFRIFISFLQTPILTFVYLLFKFTLFSFLNISTMSCNSLE